MKNRISSLCVWLCVVLCCCYATAARASDLQVGFDDRGLATLRYGGLLLTDTAAHGQDAFWLYDVDGAPIERAWDAPSRTLIWKYKWGNVACQYTQRGEQLDLDISIANRGAKTIEGFNIFPLALKFPSFPKGYDAHTPHVNFNSDGPAVQSADFGSGIVTVINRDVKNTLAVGLISTNDTGQSFRYQVYVGSTRLWYQPDNWPTFHRPIAPGARDQYQISLRFSPPGTDLKTIGQDVYRAFAQAHPSQLKWDDRRPIASLFLASASDNHAARNPRGWFYNDPEIDVTSAPGRERLRQRVLRFADDSIAELQSVGGQGMITWDIEGQFYPHATSYIGDPRLTQQLAPEMDAIADEYFARFRTAGLRVGVCVRPQKLAVALDGSAAQTDVFDVAAQLNAKISYAQNRWGATLFYVDSNGGPYDPTDAQIFAQVARAHPDVLLIPEHQNAAYYAYTAPYNHSNEPTNFTSEAVRQLYPDAFSVVKIMENDSPKLRELMAQAVRHGDILMFNGWYDSPDGALVREVYRASAPDFRVTTLRDIVAPDDGQTSLREAIIAANRAGRRSEITFADDVRGVIQLGGAALPALTGQCQIIGPGAGALGIEGGGRSGLFNVQNGAKVAIAGLTLSGGRAGEVSSYNGGALCNRGDLTLQACVLRGNTGNAGGAIFSVGGQISIERCSFVGNRANHVGGAIFSAGGALTLWQCTLSENAAPDANGGGGAICANTVDLTLQSCTVNRNSGAQNRAGVWFQGGVLTLHNSIVSGNGARDVQMDGGSLTSRGYNLIGAATPIWDWAWKSTDRRGQRADLDAQRSGDNALPTCAPLPGSAAIACRRYSPAALYAIPVPFARGRSERIAPTASPSTASLQARIAFWIARASERPWAITTTPSTPSSGAPPTSR